MLITIGVGLSNGSSTVDSLLFAANRSGNDSLRYDAFFKLAIAHIDSAYNKSINYWNNALEIAKKRKFWELSADAYHQLGYMLLKKGEFVKSLEFFKEALSIYEQTGNLLGTAAAYNDIGLVYKNWGKYDTALDNYLLAKKYYEKTKSEEGMGMVYNNIGQIYFFREEYLKAIDYFKFYLEINQKSKYYRAVAAASNNIASAYMELGSFNYAYDFFLKSLRIYDSLEIKLGVAIIQDNIGTLFLKKGQFFDALLYHTHSLDIFRKLGSTSRECISLKNIGLVYSKLKKYPDAIEYFDAALAIAQKLNLNETLQELYLYLAQAHESVNADGKALGYYKSYTQIKDSLQRVETAEKLGLLESRLEAESKARELDLLKKELEKEKKTTTYLYFLSVIIFLLVAILIYIQIKNSIFKKNLKELSLTSRDKSFFFGKLEQHALSFLSKHFPASFYVDIKASNEETQNLMLFEKDNNTILVIGNFFAMQSFQKSLPQLGERIEQATLLTPSQVVTICRESIGAGTTTLQQANDIKVGCVFFSTIEGNCSCSGDIRLSLIKANGELQHLPQEANFKINNDDTIYLYQLSSEHQSLSIGESIENALNTMGLIPFERQKEVIESTLEFACASTKEQYTIKFIALKA